MTWSNRAGCWAVVLSTTVVLGGCAPQASTEKQKTTAPKQATSEKGDTQQAADGLAELSAADAALAKQQRVCPVSGEVLGAMGKPYKVTVNGKTVFLCCSGCEKELHKNPEKYLAKLKQQEEKGGPK
jgi:YHS domain-containing protein